GVGLGISGGYFLLRTKLDQRPVTAFDVPTPVPRSGTASDLLTLRGAMIGLEAHVQRGETWPWMLRFGSGLLVGSVDDRRSGSVERLGVTGRFGPTSQSPGAVYVYFAPEIRLARRVGALELSAGLRPMLLVGLGDIRYRNEAFVTDQGAAIGQLSFPED